VMLRVAAGTPAEFPLQNFGTLNAIEYFKSDAASTGAPAEAPAAGAPGATP